MRKPNTMKRASIATHARMTKRPVVTNEVGMKPIPEEKSIFQKTVELRDASRYLSHSTPNVPGPEPKTGAEEITLFPTAKVDCHDGRTLISFTLREFARAPPSVPPIRKKMEIASMASGRTSERLLSPEAIGSS